jgi:hypothetical protein
MSRVLWRVTKRHKLGPFKTKAMRFRNWDVPWPFSKVRPKSTLTRSRVWPLVNSDVRRIFFRESARTDWDLWMLMAQASMSGTWIRSASNPPSEFSIVNFSGIRIISPWCGKWTIGHSRPPANGPGLSSSRGSRFLLFWTVPNRTTFPIDPLTRLRVRF